jgi:hypothetical protein
MDHDGDWKFLRFSTSGERSETLRGQSYTVTSIFGNVGRLSSLARFHARKDAQ